MMTHLRRSDAEALVDKLADSLEKKTFEALGN